MRRFFPCKVLLVVAGSQEVVLAAEAAVGISTQTGSDVVAVGSVKALHAAPRWSGSRERGLPSRTR